ncbi:oxidoreductase [Insolitispirillum peregrinum]|uniref:2,4-dienoyl-CoA reductase n=1 Tax=Insolitispirillum peregrinum TaxID=80876 RepID=A0A1N7LQM1_9PROT|nr:NADH:flavin oxidoreductase [Insolitispirillum peregrinum]SIS76001.1 2,4-dienoyl-CoA reductase [Insolitispirillum peregrinum]
MSYHRITRPLATVAGPLRNRLVCSPVSVNLADPSGAVNDEILHFYTSMARSGAGLVTIGATSVSPEGGSTEHGLKIGPPALDDGLRQLASAVKACGALVSLQVFHVGAQGNTAHSGQPVVGPSPYTCPDIGILAEELSLSAIARIEDEFAEAIVRALALGFDFVELHIAHGYLIHQFLSPFFNRRQDHYGGSPDNRLRFLCAIRDKAETRSPGCFRRVGARLSACDFIAGGLLPADMKAVVGVIEQASGGDGGAYYVVSAGIYETARLKYPAMRRGDYWRWAGYLAGLTSRPVVAQGGVRTLLQGEEILAAQPVALIGMAQALIADPDLLHKALAGDEGTTAVCIECGRCRYIKRSDLTFDCLLEPGYHPRVRDTAHHLAAPALLSN